MLHRKKLNVFKVKKIINIMKYFIVTVNVIYKNN